MTDYKEENDELRREIKRLTHENKALRMTALDEFAKAALTGVFANETHPDFNDPEMVENERKTWYQNVAIHCYRAAEAMVFEGECWKECL